MRVKFGMSALRFALGMPVIVVIVVPGFVSVVVMVVIVVPVIVVRVVVMVVIVVLGFMPVVVMDLVRVPGFGFVQLATGARRQVE